VGWCRAYGGWNAGAAVPQAWQIAFAGARSGNMSGLGDLLLGMNAHINRDLPYVFAGLVLVTPDGASRKPGHEKVDVFLNMVAPSLLAEEAARFDPTIDDIPRRRQQPIWHQRVGVRRKASCATHHG
jgi:hypothetical protein